MGLRRVLLVDDNADAAECLALLLGIMGYEVRTAADGAGALAVASDFRPQVVLLDIGLPGAMDGYEVAQRLRVAEATRDALLVALTGRDGEEDRKRSREVGFDHHLVKPVSKAVLEELLGASSPDSR